MSDAPDRWIAGHRRDDEQRDTLAPTGFGGNRAGDDSERNVGIALVEGRECRNDKAVRQIFRCRKPHDVAWVLVKAVIGTWTSTQAAAIQELVAINRQSAMAANRCGVASRAYSSDSVILRRSERLR